MKQFIGLFLPLISAITLFAAEPPAPVPAIVERGADFVIQETVRETAEGFVTNRWTLLQPGISRWSQSEQKWVAASDEIEITATGAEARRASFGVDFPTDPTAAPLQVTFPDGRRFRVKTMGIALTDPATGESMWIGLTRSVEGELIAQNEVRYPDAFRGIRAEIRIKVSVDRLRSDVVFLEQTPSPADFGMAPDSRLEVWHEIIEAPDYTARPSSIHRPDGALDPDTQLDFGRMVIGQGTAFMVGAASDAAADLVTQDAVAGEGLPAAANRDHHGPHIPVAKEIVRQATDGRVYLIESVRFPEAEAHLDTLPAPPQARLDLKSMRSRMEAARSSPSNTRRLAS